MAVEAGGDNTGGPMWGRFFESIGGHDDDGSMVSGSAVPTDLPPYPESPFRQDLRSPEVGPNDSASVVDDDRLSGIDYPHSRRGGLSSVGGHAPPEHVDDGTYVFKFSTPSKRTHRFQARYDDVEHLREIIIGKLETDPYFAPKEDEGVPEPKAGDFQMYYKDADGDDVYISTSEDMTDAVKNARRAGVDRVLLFLHGGLSWGLAKTGASQADFENTAPKDSTEAAIVGNEPKAVTSSPTAVDPVPAPVPVPAVPGDVFGIPRDLLLPASIGALATAIIAVFTISRLSD